MLPTTAAHKSAMDVFFIDSNPPCGSNMPEIVENAVPHSSSFDSGESPSLIPSGADLSLLASAPEGDATFAGGLREVNGRDLI